MFKNPFLFYGRFRGLEYRLSNLIYAGVIIFSILISELFSGAASSESQAVGFLIFIVYIAMIYFLLAQAAKRSHNKNNIGWWQIIPFHGFLMLFAEGGRDINDYNPNPKIQEQFYCQFAPKDFILPNSGLEGESEIRTENLLSICKDLLF